ncbi:hypothetical protein [Falsirhodobacter sp. 20TX0035]|uniref:hypothetical protein n=1 Tax=Falsirhodobacter sp. 20TX0035 TaxID=3022019 RepID=UPI00232FA02F|nr:hypothetical protein [Falsirhodobacter sp. 20TX0035]MDB6454278.1 hypothetical protein [Falsirhodobacter sp. 20TX0035]
MEAIPSEIANSFLEAGPWGVFSLVLLCAVIALWRRNSKLNDDRIEDARLFAAQILAITEKGHEAQSATTAALMGLTDYIRGQRHGA